MPRLIEYRPKNLSEYVALVQKLQSQARHALWFRGAATVKHRLIPSLYRHPQIHTQDALEKLESQLLTRFRQRSLPYHSRNLQDDWDALFFMQHYGVPTRLLDWTENPLVGLYFAVVGLPWNSIPLNGAASAKDAVVWVLNPFAWNKTALQHVSYKGEALAPGDNALNAYTPHPTATAKDTHPVALYGAHNSARIVAQQGVFTIFGTIRSPMEKLVIDGLFPANSLYRIIIKSSRLASLRKALIRQGVTESAVFPDLEGLARETKRHFGFEA